jgi:hypothetical protein
MSFPLDPEVVEAAIEHLSWREGHVRVEAAIRAALDKLGLREETRIVNLDPAHPNPRLEQRRLVSDWRPVDREPTVRELRFAQATIIGDRVDAEPACGSCAYCGGDPWHNVKGSLNECPACGKPKVRPASDRVDSELSDALSDFRVDALEALKDLVMPLEELPQSDRLLRLIEGALEEKRFGGAAGPASVGEATADPSDDRLRRGSREHVAQPAHLRRASPARESPMADIERVAQAIFRAGRGPRRVRHGDRRTVSLTWERLPAVPKAGYQMQARAAIDVIGHVSAEAAVRGMASLSYREREVLIRRFGPDAESRDALASFFHVSASRIGHIEECALRKLQSVMSATSEGEPHG